MNAGPGAKAFVALGSNLGNPVENILAAMRRLESLSHHPLLRSACWCSDPVDCPPGSPSFINAAVGFVPFPNETPESLLAKLQALEREFGRLPKTTHNEARPLDLDLIAFGDQVRNTESLTLPHPRAHLRRFVLEPLNEIAPQLLLPGQIRPVAELLKMLAPDESVRRCSS